MKKIYWAAVAYTVLGLLAGLYYREMDKAHDVSGFTQLSVVHTHLLALGTTFLLIVLVLEKVFALTRNKWFGAFFWIYNTGLVVTVAMLVIHGTMTMLGNEAGSAISGIAGLGHVVLTIGFVFFFVSLYAGVSGKTTGRPQDDPEPSGISSSHR